MKETDGSRDQIHTVGRLFILQSCMSRESSIAGGRDIANASAFASCNVPPQAFCRIWEGRIKGSLKARLCGGGNLETLFRSCSNLLFFLLSLELFGGI